MLGKTPHVWFLAGALGASFLWPPLPEYGMAEITLAATTLFTLGAILSPSARLAVRLRGWPLAAALCAVCLFALLVLSAFTSLVPSRSLLQVGFYTTPFLVALGCFLSPAMTEGKNAKAALIVAGALLTVLATGALVQTALQGLTAPDTVIEPMQTNRATWPFSDSNHLGAVLTAGVLMALAAFAGTRGEDRRTSLALAALCFAGVLATGSRGAMLGLLGGGGFLALFLMPKAALRWSTLRRPAYVALAILAVFALTQPLTSFIPFRLFLILVDFDNATGSRFLFWPPIWDQALTRPWLGHGLGTFPIIYAQLAQPTHMMGGYAAHNDPLQLALESGLPTAVLFYLLGISVMGGTLAFVKKTENTRAKVQTLGATAVLLALAIHIHVEFLLGVLPLMMILGIALGVWFSHFHAIRTLTWEPPWRSVRAGLALIAGLLWALSASQLAGLMTLSQAQEDLAHGNIAEFAQKLETAKTLSLDLSPEPYRMAAQFHMGLLQAGNPGNTTSQEQVKTLIQNILDRNPLSSAAHEMAGDLALMSGESPEAEWNEALRLERRGASVRLKLARFYEASGKQGEADALLTESLRWLPNALKGSRRALYEEAEKFFTEAEKPDLVKQAQTWKKEVPIFFQNTTDNQGLE